MSKSKLYLDYSPTEAKSSLDRIQEGINDLLPELKDAKKRDILLVLGNTRVGKSTLVNYLSGAKLVCKENPDDPDELVLYLEEKSTGAEIGHETESQTKIPTKHIATKVADMQLWDVPGFNESSTREQDIVNTYLIQELMRTAQSIRIVLVASYGNISSVEAIKPFCEFLSTIATIFPNLDQVQDKFTIVFTKAPSNTDASKLSNLLKLKVLNPTSNGKIDNYYGSAEKREKCKPIIEHFVKNPDKIGVFVRPDIAGPIEDKVINPDNNISKTILSSSQVRSSQLKDVKIGAHPDSIIFVRENLKTIGEYYKTKVQSEARNQIELYLSRIEDAYKKGSYKKLIDIRSELVYIQKYVVKEQNSLKGLEMLCEMNIHAPYEGLRFWSERSPYEIIELVSFSETIKHCTAMLKKAIGEPTLDDLLLVQLSIMFNTVSAHLLIAQVCYLGNRKKLDIPTCQKLIDEVDKRGFEIRIKLLNAEKEILKKIEIGLPNAEKEILEKAQEQLKVTFPYWTSKTAAFLGGVMGFFIMPYLKAKADIEEAEGFLETTGAVAKGVVYALPRAVQGARDGSKAVEDIWCEHLVKEYAQVNISTDSSNLVLFDILSNTDEASSSGKADIEEVEAGDYIDWDTLDFIDFSIPSHTDEASSSKTVSCILGMEYENEILNYPEVLKVLTDSLAINYSDVLDKVGGFDQEFVREACLSGNVELLEECFGN